MNLGNLIFKRILIAIPTTLAASVVVFVLLMVGPNPLTQLAQESDVDIEQISATYGWDRPWIVQYGDWAKNFVRGDWGTSIRTNEPAAKMIRERLPVTAALTLTSSLIAGFMTILMSVWVVKRRNTRSDHVLVSTMVAISALPSFMIALLLQWFAVQAKDFSGTTLVYVGGMPRDGGLLELIQRLALPIAVLTLIQMGAWLRFQRAALLDVIDNETITSVRGRGIPEDQILRRHALPQTAAPLITLMGLELGTMLGGTLIVETVFGLPGIGRLLIDSVQTRDMVVALDIIAISAFTLVIASTVIDIVTARLDPRAASSLG